MTFEILAEALPTQIYFASTSILILILCSLRIYDNEQSIIDGKGSTTADPLSQLGHALLSTFNKSIAPLQTTYNGKHGHSYYPLGLYWYSNRLLKNFPTLRKLVPNNSSSISKLLGRPDNYLDTYIVFLKIVSGIIFPVITFLLCQFTIFFQMESTYLSLTGCLACLVLIDSIYSKSYYVVSTRNAGLFVYTTFFFILTWAVTNSYDDRINYILMISMIFAISSLLQISQRYAQACICTLIAISFFVPAYTSTIIFSFVISIMILANMPWSNFIGFIISHIWNRIGDDSWSYRTYGPWRYKLFGRLRGNSFNDFLRSALLFDYIKEDFNISAFYKQNMSSLFAVFRVFIWGSILVFSLNSSESLKSSTELMSIFIASTIIPTLLCNFRPFQGYGSGEVYFIANLAPMYISYLIFTSKFILSESPSYATTIVIVSLIEIIMILGCGVKKITLKAKDILINKLWKEKSDMLSSFVNVGANNDIVKLVSTLKQIAHLSQSNEELVLCCHGIHLLTIVDLCEQFIRRENGRQVFKSPFKLIDSSEYRFFDDWKSHFISEAVIFNKIKPDLLILDKTKDPSAYLLNFLNKQRTKGIATIHLGCIAIVILNISLLNIIRQTNKL